MLDHAGRAVTVVPHQPVERCHVDEEPRLVGEGVPRVDGVGARDVVLQIDGGEPLLLWAEQFRHVLAQVLRGLQHDDVEIELADLFGRHLMHGVRQIERRAAAAVPLRTARLDRQEPVVVDARERVEVAAVDVPDENLQPAHAMCSWSENRLSEDSAVWRTWQACGEDLIDGEALQRRGAVSWLRPN